ncbi:MAG: hypothetical protein K0R47_3573 [Brevibacillus sp.]|jgi:hypothetical protein|nr:hypothetical protein [Brevibacillus sp.]
MDREAENEIPKINLFTTKQNMDTPLITEQEEDTESTNSGNLEVDSDVNEDPNRERLLDDSLQSFLESYNKE